MSKEYLDRWDKPFRQGLCRFCGDYGWGGWACEECDPLAECVPLVEADG